MTEHARLAVIVGAGAGIGQGAAVALAEAGYRVVCADIDLAAAEETVRLIGASGHAFAVDARDRDATEALADEAEAIGPIDLWINSAGIGAVAPLCDITPELYDKVRRVNMDGTLWGCAAAARRMIPRKQGSIINISSNAADQPIATLSVYAMTKAAVNMLTRSLALELGRDGIRVNGIAPGFIVTPMTVSASLSPEEREALIERNASRSPLHRVGQPQDIAAAVLYLASDAARFVTGQTLRVNGGVSMP
ncbi:SDR family oxidoreductase [soil metagenome]